MQKLTARIGFFDSGIGGLTVLKECVPRLDQCTYFYYGDTVHAPYGNLPNEKIKEYVFAAFECFFSLGVDAAVVACNTATAVCVDELRSRFSFPIIGTEPAVFTAAQEGGEVLVLCTRATYESARFHTLCREAQRRFPQSNVSPYFCEELAGAIERANLRDLPDFSAYLPKRRADGVVLGCTHYAFIKEQIERFYHCRAYDGAQGVVKRLESVLTHSAQPPVTTCFATPDFLTKTDRNPLSVSFLGEGKMVIKTKYEQMFAIK